jgi:hypothetical protein
MLTQKIKNELIAEAIEHRKQDLFIRGKYWDGHKGCSVGCFVKTRDNPHAKLAERTGLPVWLHYLQDRLFEDMTYDNMPYWSERFFKAAPVGLTSEQIDKQIKAPFLIFVLESTLDKFDHDKYPDVLKSIQTVIDLYKSGEIDVDKFKAAADAARAAADAVWSAAACSAACAAAIDAAIGIFCVAPQSVADAVWAAARSADAIAARAVARADAWAAVDDAWAAVDDASDAVDSAAATATTVARAAAARVAEYDKFADKLIGLMEGARIEGSRKC